MKRIVIFSLLASFLFISTSCNKNENKDYKTSAIVETFSFNEGKQLLNNHHFTENGNGEVMKIAYNYEKENKELSLSINYTNKNKISNEEHIITFENFLYNINYIDEDKLLLTTDGVYAPCEFKISYENDKKELIKEEINKYRYNYYPTFSFTTNNAKNLDLSISFKVKTDELPVRFIATYYSSLNLLKENKHIEMLGYGYLNKPSYILGNIDETNKFNKTQEILNGSINYTYSVNKENDYYLNKQEINLDVKEVLNDTTYSFKPLDFSMNEDNFLENYVDKDNNKLFLRNTTINYEYTLNDKLVKETINKYYVDDIYSLSISIKFPKNSKNIKLNISNSMKKKHKICAFLEGIQYSIN